MAWKREKSLRRACAKQVENIPKWEVTLIFLSFICFAWNYWQQKDSGVEDKTNLGNWRCANQDFGSFFNEAKLLHWNVILQTLQSSLEGSLVYKTNKPCHSYGQRSQIRTSPNHNLSFDLKLKLYLNRKSVWCFWLLFNIFLDLILPAVNQKWKY